MRHQMISSEQLYRWSETVRRNLVHFPVSDNAATLDVVTELQQIVDEIRVQYLDALIEETRREAAE